MNTFWVKYAEVQSEIDKRFVTDGYFCSQREIHINRMNNQDSISSSLLELCELSQFPEFKTYQQFLS